MQFLLSTLTVTDKAKHQWKLDMGEGLTNPEQANINNFNQQVSQHWTKRGQVHPEMDQCWRSNSSISANGHSDSTFRLGAEPF